MKLTTQPYGSRADQRPSSGPPETQLSRSTLSSTTNRGVGAWGEIFADTTIAAAMLDRLLHRSVVINITGDSYRMRAHRARSRKLSRGGDA